MRQSPLAALEYHAVGDHLPGQPEDEPQCLVGDLIGNVARDLENPWSYYPLKFSWLMAAILGLLAAGAAAAVCVRLLRAPWLLVFSLLLVAAITTTFLEWAPRSSGPYTYVASSFGRIGHDT